MNELKKYTSLGIVALACATGCVGLNTVEEMPDLNGYSVTLLYSDIEGSDRRISIYRKNSEIEESLSGQDFNGDNRIDRIFLDAPNGSPLEELASVEKMSELLTNYMGGINHEN
ncbi:hypothetical protein HN681_00610 [archaeon]|jgi:hypothetical protein|nr:hypothetical protein [archaeon]MBT3730713.1 hypothetical protein [archaeon]MBT4669615.1 hypothetical protein [archaeon]MBT5030372.1 hypothetical protein [archaeon]MBT5288335.1 hypothetical protein [archaeon]